ncbi:class I SAM-dependent methyltransferase [Brevibacillus laterosporus]|uniref:Class I SAM-dependent methyltransferase n=1 Tax=Brevibacillus laterosporus TaxID=1465 RepID=A0A518VF23_BRELA|nr:class I SAM-dependent methyltransferase [Brevibacillus laterosporus]QDX95607.1 class I SAM-dependent methyltransferase [Brevibacillus laterosporus]RAP28036.1 Phosphatidylethanolamine N-methyltransferase [Brevibacillus laterosporus]TPG69515.1 class I SAM-dependent methyltransferase [Brevibacillus laterosporus]
MNNSWNKFIYRIGAPFYDALFNSGSFLRARKQVFDDLPLRAGQHILIVGVGTGADLCFFAKQDIQITAIDISSSMISQAKEKVSTQMNIDFIEMDAQHLLFPDKSFDMIIANLILSVVPDANRCMQEIIRVTKEHGNIVVFDKFESKHKKLSFGKQLLRPIISILGTDIGRNFETMIEPFHKKVIIQEDTPVLFNGMYRKIIMKSQ